MEKGTDKSHDYQFEIYPKNSHSLHSSWGFGFWGLDPENELKE